MFHEDLKRVLLQLYVFLRLVQDFFFELQLSLTEFHVLTVILEIGPLLLIVSNQLFHKLCPVEEITDAGSA